MLQDDCSRTSSDHMNEVNSCSIQLRVLAEFAVRLVLEDLIVRLEELQVNVHALRIDRRCFAAG